MESDKETENTDAATDEFIVSLCWDSGKLAASYYNLITLELMVMNEAVDLRPDHIMLRNIFRQTQPEFLIATGPNNFLMEMMDLLDLPETDISKYKVGKGKTANANTSNISFYPFDPKRQQESYRKRIYDLDLPGMTPELNSHDRKVFVDSLFPMNQELTVITVGNLLKYMFENNMKWRHAYLQLEPNPIITKVTSLHIEAQVHIDDTTFNSLNIFSNVHHPSSFKAQIRRDGLSIFNMLNQCMSSLGVQHLKQILKQPIRDLNELKLRQKTIEWCLRKENFETVLKLKERLRNVLNINAVMGRIIANHGRTADWKSLKKTVHFSNNICEMCASLNASSIRGSLLEELALFHDDDLSINAILVALDKIVDFEGIVEKKRFVVKEDLDPTLDELRGNLNTLTQDFVERDPDRTLLALGADLTDFHFVHFPELGFVVGTHRKIDELDLSSTQQNRIQLLLHTVDATYFRTQSCKFLNDEYDLKLSEIIEREMGIFNRLIKFINENMNDLNEIMKACAKLDVLISFASVSATFNFVKPTITTDKKLVIKNGRHPLVERLKDYVPSTTIIDSDNPNFINVIVAPNSSGKSVYMKQIAIICYLAHIGMYVPADECTVSLLSSIFTRIYTPESVYQGESAFLSDLQQLSKVVMSSDNRSLILIDEFGKGTMYKDGLALLAATIEEFIQRKELGPIIFIATHYHYIFDIIRPSNLVNMKTVTTQKNNSGVFQSLYEVTDGANIQSFSTEFPESLKIMKNILDDNDKDFDSFNESYQTAIKALIIILVKQFMRYGRVNYDLIEGLYSKTDIKTFIGCE